MCQEAFQVKWVKVPPIQSLASRIVPSLAMKQVTASRSVDREDAGCKLWVNGLSPENVSSWGADSVQGTGRQQRSSRYVGEAVDTHRGLRRRHVFNDLRGTWESQDASTGWYGATSRRGKELQKGSWQSDQLIVVMKSRKRDGAKGLAGRP